MTARDDRLISDETVMCRSCGDQGRIEQHHPKCDGDKGICYHECPVQEQCADCGGTTMSDDRLPESIEEAILNYAEDVNFSGIAHYTKESLEACQESLDELRAAIREAIQEAGRRCCDLLECPKHGLPTEVTYSENR